MVEVRDSLAPRFHEPRAHHLLAALHDRDRRSAVRRAQHEALLLRAIRSQPRR